MVTSSWLGVGEAASALGFRGIPCSRESREREQEMVNIPTRREQ